MQEKERIRGNGLLQIHVVYINTGEMLSVKTQLFQNEWLLI